MFVAVLLVLALAALSSGINAVYVLGRLRRAGAPPLLLICIGTLVWSVGHGLELTSLTADRVIFWDNVQFLGADLCAAGALFLAGHDRPIPRWQWVILAIIPVPTLMAFADPAFGVVRLNAQFEQRFGLAILRYDYGVLMWAIVSYDYVLLVWAMARIGWRVAARRGVFRRQWIVLLVGMLVPFVGTVLTVSGNLPGDLPKLDISPATLSFAHILYSIALFRLRLLDLVPLARTRVFETLREAVLVVDGSDTLVDANESARRAWPWLRPGERLPARGIAVEDTDGRLLETAVGPTWFEQRVTVIEPTPGGESGRALVLFDITERRLALEGLRAREADLIRAREEAEHLARARSDFLSRMSHEIRTPLNGIIGFADLMLTREGQLSRDELAVIQKSARHLKSLVDDILDYARLQSGRVRPDERVFSLDQLLEDLRQMLQGRADEKGLVLSFAKDADVPVALQGDSTALGQILLNLLDNAIKFTPHGRVSLRVSLEDWREELLLISLCVEDTGPGVAPHLRKRIFDPFEQESAGISRRHGGTGLGLAIVAELARHHGGSVRCEAGPDGTGAAFTALLPFRSAAELPPVEPARPPASIRGERILLVEDDEANQVLATRILVEAGALVDAVWGGKEAIELLREQEYDIVLLDLHMPGMDGFETLREIRSLRGSRLPVIALSADAMPETLVRVAEAGFTAYLSKPYTVAQLREVLSPLVARTR